MSALTTPSSKDHEQKTNEGTGSRRGLAGGASHNDGRGRRRNLEQGFTWAEGGHQAGGSGLSGRPRQDDSATRRSRSGKAEEGSPGSAEDPDWKFSLCNCRRAPPGLQELLFRLNAMAKLLYVPIAGTGSRKKDNPGGWYKTQSAFDQTLRALGYDQVPEQYHRDGFCADDGSAGGTAGARASAGARYPLKAHPLFRHQRRTDGSGNGKPTPADGTTREVHRRRAILRPTTGDPTGPCVSVNRDARTGAGGERVEDPLTLQRPALRGGGSRRRR